MKPRRGGAGKAFGFLADASESLHSHEPQLKKIRFVDIHSTRFALQPQDSPFAYIVEGYRLLATDRVAAARNFEETARRIPTPVTQQPRVATYIAAFYLTAGHIFEIESRTQGNRELAADALRCFDSAQALLPPGISTQIAFPFRLSRARALVVTGRVDEAKALAGKLRNFPDNARHVATASQAYDVACLYAALGSHKESIEQLRRSFEA